MENNENNVVENKPKKKKDYYFLIPIVIYIIVMAGSVIIYAPFILFFAFLFAIADGAHNYYNEGYTPTPADEYVENYDNNENNIINNVFENCSDIYCYLTKRKKLGDK